MSSFSSLRRISHSSPQGAHGRNITWRWVLMALISTWFCSNSALPSASANCLSFQMWASIIPSAQ